MDNYYHLLIETSELNLSRMMRNINGHYTIYFNRTYKRYGYLLQGRYQAILVDKDNYLLPLSRYIHLNPVRAGILPRPEEYHYSSMPYYTGKNKPSEWQNARFVLEQFGSTIKQQQGEYKSFAHSPAHCNIDLI